MGDVILGLYNESVESAQEINDDTSEEPIHIPSDKEENLLGEVFPQPSVGDAIEVYWPDDDKFYPGKVTSFTPNTGDIHVHYDDGDQEALKIQEETWRFSSQETDVVNGVELAPGMNLPSIEKEINNDYNDVFGSKEFLLHHAQGLPSFAIQNADMKEEESFTKSVRKVHVKRVPVGSNVISSHDDESENRASR